MALLYGWSLSTMKPVTAVVALSLVALIFSANVTQAQSRHNRVVQGTTGSSANPGKTTSPGTAAPDLSPDAGVASTGVIPGGETVEGDVVRVDTSLVTVPVSVMDRDGRYVPNLGRNSFRIFDDNVEQKIAYFATVDKPFTVALVIDTSRSTHFRLEDIQDAAIAFVQQLQPADRVMVVSFDDHIRVLSEPTNDRDELAKAIRRTRTGGSTRLYDAMDFVINKRLNHITGRKAVVLFTDGVDTTSHNASYESTVRDAEELDALIYTVEYDTFGDINHDRGQQQGPFPRNRGGIILGMPFPRGSIPGTGTGGGGGGGGGWPGGGGGGGSSRADYARADQYLHELPQKTGARFYNANTLENVAQAFAQVAEELRRQYSLGYYPTPLGVAGQRRQIKVRVTEPNLVVVARDSYIYSQKKTEPSQTSPQQFSSIGSQENRLGKIY
jgi:VWFA-related protein